MGGRNLSAQSRDSVGHRRSYRLPFASGDARLDRMAANEPGKMARA